MPFPLIPFAIKGAIVVTKMLAAKGAAAKAAYGTVQVVKAVGVAKAAAGATAALVVVGGIAWTAENAMRAKRAYLAAKAGRLTEAGRELAGVASSVHGAFSNNLAGELRSWAVAGYPADARVLRLATSAYDAARQAKAID